MTDQGSVVEALKALMSDLGPRHPGLCPTCRGLVFEDWPDCPVCGDSLESLVSLETLIPLAEAMERENTELRRVVEAAKAANQEARSELGPVDERYPVEWPKFAALDAALQALDSLEEETSK